MARTMYDAVVELAERYDSLDQADIGNRLDQLRKLDFYPAIGWGEQGGTAITISFKADKVMDVNDFARKLINELANPNRVGIVNVAVRTTTDFVRVNAGIDYA